jgi:hypothetical protein
MRLCSKVRGHLRLKRAFQVEMALQQAHRVHSYPVNRARVKEAHHPAPDLSQSMVDRTSVQVLMETQKEMEQEFLTVHRWEVQTLLLCRVRQRLPLPLQELAQRLQVHPPERELPYRG